MRNINLKSTYTFNAVHDLQCWSLQNHNNTMKNTIIFVDHYGRLIENNTVFIGYEV